MLTVPEQYAGQPMKCPLCNGTFTVPSLPAAVPEPAVAAASETYSLQHERVPPPATSSTGNSVASPEPVAAPPVATSPAPSAPGEYHHGFTLRVNPRVVPWLAPVGLLLVFVMMFFSWVPGFSWNAWEWGFGGPSSSSLIGFYCILTVLALLVAVAVLLMNLKIIPDVPALKPVHPWRGLIVAGLTGLAFLFLLIQFLRYVFGAWVSPLVTMWAMLAFWVHLIALIGALLEFWLERRGPSRPLPRIDGHW
jgi:hypothetical protein